MRKRILLLLMYFLYGSGISFVYIIFIGGMSAPFTVFVSWGYILTSLWGYTFIRLLLFYLFYLSITFFLGILINMMKNKYPHLFLAIFHFLGAAIALSIQPRPKEISFTYICFGIFAAAGVVLYYIADWQFAKESTSPLPAAGKPAY